MQFIRQIRQMKQKRKVRFWMVVIIVVILFIGGALLIRHKKNALARAPRYGVRPVPVRVTTSTYGDLPVKTDYLAVVEPNQLANVSARLTATVEKVFYDEGDSVGVNDILIILDSREIEKSIHSVESQIAQVRSNLKANEATIASLVDTLSYWQREAHRDKILSGKGDIPPSQAEATADKANEYQGKLIAARHTSEALRHLIQSLKSKKAELKTKLSYCTIRSPYKGVIARREVDPGDLASPGKVLMVIEDRSRIKLAFDIPQQDLPDIREGLDVTFVVDNEFRRAKLSHIHPSLNNNRMLRAEIYLSGGQSEGLSSGEYIPISVVLDKMKNVVLLPASCIIENISGETYVFLVRDNVLIPKVVDVLGGRGDVVAVGGIKQGERVVTSTFLGWAKLSSGKKVEIIE